MKTLICCLGVSLFVLITLYSIFILAIPISAILLGATIFNIFYKDAMTFDITLG